MTRSTPKTSCCIRATAAAALLATALLAHAGAPIGAIGQIASATGTTNEVLSIVRQQNQHIRQGAMSAAGAFGAAPAQRTPHDNGVNPAAEVVKNAKTVVFISMTMPDRELKELFDEGAGHPDTVFFLRGLEANSGRKTVDHIKNIVGFKDHVRDPQPNIVVLPQAFARWSVTEVPVVMHESATDHRWYRADGAISIQAATHDIDAGLKPRAAMTWPVREQDLAKVFRDRMDHYDWSAWQDRTTKQYTSRLEKGTPLALAQSDTRYTVNLGVTFPQDIHDKQGRLIIAKGTTVNPLATRGLPGGAIIVVDPSDNRQISMARKWVQQYPHARLLVTHFDEEGLHSLIDATGIKPMMLDAIIVKRFGLRTVPSLLTTQNSLLLVQSYAPRVEGGTAQ